MLQATVEPDVIFDTETGAFIPRGNYLWPEDESLIQPMPAPTLADVISKFIPAMQTYMDGVAQQNGYDSVVSCASYISSSVRQWSDDATAMVKWRDAMWSWAYAQQTTLAGMTPVQISALTVDDIIAQAPKAADSGWVVHAPGAPTA